MRHPLDARAENRALVGGSPSLFGQSHPTVARKVIVPVEFWQRLDGADRTGNVKAFPICSENHRVNSYERGSIMVEYAVLLSVVAVVLSLAVVALGVPLLRMYLTQQTWLLLPLP
jgi:Flp pilus assembly pilin Flp